MKRIRNLRSRRKHEEKKRRGGGEKMKRRSRVEQEKDKAKEWIREE